MILHLVLAACLTLALGSSARAQSDATVTPEGQYTLVQKNLGTQRWAIVRDQTSKTITGNIFNPEGGSQFVWCNHLGGEAYSCVGNNGCNAEPCTWATIADVTIPEWFFQVRGGPAPTAAPTPRPTPRPTPKPTPPPASGLQGLLGTWDFTFRIISTFTFQYRLQRTQTSTSGYPIIVGRNELGDTILVARVQDIDPGNTLPYDYTLFEQTVGICNLYVFDQTGTDRVSGLHASAFQQSNGDCGTLLGQDPMTGVRVSRLASDASKHAASTVKRAVNRHARALRAEMREAPGDDTSADLDTLLRAMTVVGQSADAP